MKNILLINPKYRLEIRWVASESEIDVKADYFPLGLGTLAALTPDDGFHVDIYDELVKGPIEKNTPDTRYDLVGITSHSANLGRACELGDHFRRQGILTAVGGPGVTSNPDRCRTHFDLVFIGEAELIWPQFLRDWQAESHEVEYRQIVKPDLSLSPVPKWDSIALDVKRYAMGTIQTTRGCPIGCEFCDVIYLNGRLQRHKPVPQILAEIEELARLGVESISFNDDNFTAVHRRAKKVLRTLIDFNRSLQRPIRFMTQLGIDVSRDDELLELLADANFYEVLIGIETPNKESLKEAGKLNNLKGDMVAEIRKVLSYGIAVRGAMIVGFDHDDTGIFDQQYEFIQEAHLPSISLHMLNAPVGTRLWRRLRAEGRVIDAFSIADQSTQRLFNNIIPKRMSRVELMQGFRDLYARVFTWESFCERMLGFVSLVRKPPAVRLEQPSIQSLLELGPSLNLDQDSCESIAEIFVYTQQHAPFLLGRVKELVVQFIRYRKSALSFLPGLDRQIELESSGTLRIQLDNRPILIPPGFRASFDKILPPIYRQVHRKLIDKEKLPDALVEIFTDFIVHNENFEELLEYHMTVLHDLTEQVCSRFNGDGAAPRPAASAATDSESDLKPLRMQADILNGLEQELRKTQTPKRC